MSKSYKIEIEETLSRVLEIKANSLEDAISIVQQKYSNEEYLLNENDYKGVDIRAYEDEKIKEKNKLYRER